MTIESFKYLLVSEIYKCLKKRLAMKKGVFSYLSNSTQSHSSSYPIHLNIIKAYPQIVGVNNLVSIF